MEKMSVLTLILLSVSGVYSDSHSLSYHFTAVSAPGFGLPEFCRVGCVDGQQIDLYTSDAGRAVPVAPWMKTMSPEYWVSETLFDKEAEAVYRQEVKTSRIGSNHTVDSHSLRYYFMGVTAPGSGLPEFSIVGYVDDQKTEKYTSDIGRRVPVAPWLKEKEDPEYWERETLADKEVETVYNHEVFNLTGGFHYIQAILGCELGDDGSTIGYQESRYDGREFMYLDVQTGLYIPTMAEAQIIAQRLNSPDERAGERAKIDLEIIWIERLKRHLEYGRKDLERRVRPRVKVTGRESDGITKLHCQAYGFYPRIVDVKWVKNEIDDVPLSETTHVLPNPDGTYQIRVAVEVIPKEGNSYSCYVDHSSLEEPLLVKWESKEDSHLAVIISAVIIVLVLTSVTAGVIIYKKKKDKYTAAGVHPRFTRENLLPTNDGFTTGEKMQSPGGQGFPRSSADCRVFYMGQ